MKYINKNNQQNNKLHQTNDKKIVFFSHYTVKCFDIDSKLLNSRKRMCECLKKISKEIKLNIIKRIDHQFKPHGLTIIFILSESHIALHTWPESNFAHLDIITCSKKIKFNKLALVIKKYLTTNNFRIKKLIY